MENSKKSPSWQPLFQRVKRVVAVLVCAAFLGWRAHDYPQFWSKSLWFLETALYAALICNYLTRLPPVSPARGVREMFAPYFIAALPFAVFFLPVNGPLLSRHPVAFYAGQILLLVGTAVTLLGMATLRRSFSISVEARAPVTHGLYRWIRHPIYLGEMVSLSGVALIRLSPLSVGLALAFVLLQGMRARWEEEKLAAAFPEYAEHRRTTAMFLPPIHRR